MSIPIEGRRPQILATHCIFEGPATYRGDPNLGHLAIAERIESLDTVAILDTA